MRFAKTLVENERLSPYDAQRRAKETFGQLWAEQDRRAVEEMREVTGKLAALNESAT